MSGFKLSVITSVITWWGVRARHTDLKSPIRGTNHGILSADIPRLRVGGMTK